MPLFSVTRRAVTTSTSSATCEAGNDDVEEADDAIDDGREDGADAIDDGHQNIADGLADRPQLQTLLARVRPPVTVAAYTRYNCAHGDCSIKLLQ